MFADFFLKKTCAELNKKFEGFDEEVMQLFLNYDWPGNLRELRNVIRRAGLLAASGKITTNVLPWEIIGNPLKPISAPPPVINQENAFDAHKQPPADLKVAASQAEYEMIMNVLKQVKFNKTKAAEALKIDRKTLYNKIRHYEESNSIKE